MRGLAASADAASRGLGYAAGALAVGVAVAAWATSQGAAAIGAWALKVLGPTFLGLLAALTIAAAFCWARLIAVRDPAERRFWLGAGLHAADGVSTLALTYTLLGISLGIGGLAETRLSQDTIQEVIRGLTEHFSLAFLTTVIGLPLATALRAVLTITASRRALGDGPALPSERVVP